MKRERGRPPGGHKTITIGAVTWSLSDLAKHLGINLPTLAKRVRAYEDGTMALAAVLAKGRAPHEPRKATSSVSREALQKALQGSKGEIAGAAAALGLSRQWANVLVDRYDLRAEVEKLRAGATWNG